MIREAIDPFANASLIMQALSKGILLTSQAGQRVNTMTIAWGFLGVDWKLPIFVTLVRTGRFTRILLDQNPEFTVNVPIGAYDSRILGVAGTKSGRDLDKISALGLHLVAGETVSVPAIMEFPLTLECKVIYKKQQDPEAIPLDLRNLWHPQEVDSSKAGANRDYHIAYYGAISAAYILR